jgi:hypothetical protein
MGAEPIARAWWWLVAVSTLLLVGVTLSRANLPDEVTASEDTPIAGSEAGQDRAVNPQSERPPDPAVGPADDVVLTDAAADDIVESSGESDGSGGTADADNAGPVDDAAEPAAPAPVREGSDDEPCAFRLNRATVARNVEHREPVGADGPFAADGTPLFVFIDADNRGEDASDFATVRWIHRATGGVWSNRARLGRNHRWRTWVDRVLPATRVGAWQAQIIDDQGCLLSTLDFEVIPHGW